VAVRDQDIRAALDRHWAASAAGDVEVQHEIYAADVVCEYPQSGERICGRQNLQAIRSHDLIKPASFSVRRVLGSGDLWITEYVVMTTYKEPMAHGVSIMKFREIEVYLETLYIAAPFTPPSGRAQWVQRTGW
jgi:hypothetical protein